MNYYQLENWLPESPTTRTRTCPQSSPPVRSLLSLSLSLQNLISSTPHPRNQQKPTWFISGIHQIQLLIDTIWCLHPTKRGLATNYSSIQSDTQKIGGDCPASEKTEERDWASTAASSHSWPLASWLRGASHLVPHVLANFFFLGVAAGLCRMAALRKNWTDKYGGGRRSGWETEKVVLHLRPAMEDGEGERERESMREKTQRGYEMYF